MNGNRVMLQAAMNGGFFPPKEAREIEAALERMEREKLNWTGDTRDRAEAVLRWFRTQGAA